MKYNNVFSVNDFFGNRKMSGVLPQFYKGGSRKTALSNTEIFKRCQRLLCNVLDGTIVNDTIEVRGKKSAAVLSLVKTTKPILEEMFNNIDKVLAALKRNEKLYTKAASVTQVKNLSDPRRKIEFLKDVTDNLLYNPNFNDSSKTTSAYKRRQSMWQRKVGYTT